MKPTGGARWAVRARMAAAGITVALGLLGCAERDAVRQRIVLVTVDTLRYDGLDPEVMPRTSALAARGLVFDRAWAATSATQPTHASLFTGEHPWQHGVTRNGAVLDERHRTVAERLSGAGFTTGAVVASFPLHARFGFAQGFDVYEDDFRRTYALRSWEGTPLEAGTFYSLADDVTDAALAMLDGAVGDDQFFWFHYFDPHDPYGDAAGEALLIGQILTAARGRDPAAAALAERAHELYERDLAALDRSLGRLWARLAEDEERFETSIVFTSDHGESFGEHGSIGHGKRLTEEQVHVPLVVVSPGIEPARRDDVAGSVDVAATLLGLGGLPPDPQRGRDLLQPVGAAEGVAFGMRRTFATPRPEQLLDGTLRPVTGARFYAVHDGVLLTGDGKAVTEGDVPERPVEDERTATLRALFAAFEEELSGTPTEELLDEEVQEALEALGYVR